MAEAQSITHDKPGISADAIDTAAEGLDLRQIIAIIRSHLIWIILVMAGAFVLGFVATMLQTPQYTAYTSVQIDDAAAQVLQNGQDVQSSSSVYDVDRFLNTQLDVLKSKALARRVADRLKLYGNPRFMKAMGVQIDSTTPMSKADLEESTIGIVRSRMSVSLPRQSRVASIAVITADPQMSADIANAYASEFIQANLQRKFESSDYARQFVAQQLDVAKQRVEAAERDLNAYSRDAGLIRTRGVSADGRGNVASDASVTTSSLMQANTAANEARTKRVEAEARWKAVSAGNGLSASEVLTNRSVQFIMEKRADAESKLREERSRHLDEHPNVQRLLAQIDGYNQELKTIVSGVRSSVQQEYQAALSAERELNAQVAALKNETLNEQDRGVRYAILAREADTSRTLYEGLLQRYKELTAAAGISSSNIALIDKAAVPTGPSSPILFLNLAYALFAGFVVSALLVFIRLQLDDAVRVPEDVEHKLSLPVLGIIPKLFDQNPREQLADPKSSMSEAYNSLRGAVSFATANGAPRVLLITSASAGEGKSTTSFSLARGFAKLGKRVLLIDVDMRRPSVHRQFDAENELGLSSVLVGQAMLADAIKQSDSENLSYLTAGPIPPSPTELLASPRLQTLIEDGLAMFDMIVLDAPPILGLADAPLLSSFAEGTLLVLESDRNRRGVLKGTLRRLRLAHGRVIGVALTKFDATHASSYTYYYGYGYDYYAYDNSERRGRRNSIMSRLRRLAPKGEQADA